MTLGRFRLLSFLLILQSILLAACGNTNTPSITTNDTTTPQIIIVTATQPPTTNTPNPCAPENIEGEVQKLHAHMREFDDASTLAASRPRDDLAGSIADLQRIRREAEDQLIPPCLTTLKAYQISHMNSVINTLISFMGGAEQTTVDQGIALAREQHDQYTLELARLLGITVEPATGATPEQTPTP